MRALVAALALAALPIALSSAAGAREIAMPLTLDHAFVRQRAVETLFAEPGESSPPLRDATGCNEVVLSGPTLSGRDGHLVVTARIAAKVGAGTGGFCLGAMRRSGILEARLEPRLVAERPVVAFRVVGSDLYDPDGRKRLAGALWDWLAHEVHPHLETLRLDLHQPVSELRAFLPLLLADRDRARAQRMIDSLALSDVDVREDAVVLRLRLDVPEPAAAPPLAPPEAAWTPEEIARFETTWQSWDAFLAFLVKHGARDADAAQRRELAAILLDARHDLVAILADPGPSSPDPVRALFQQTWERLAPLLRTLSLPLPGREAFAYLSFVAAGDAYEALDTLGPGYGIELSTDGLRRMARMLEPAPRVDPTAWSDAIDAELRALFGLDPQPPELPGGPVPGDADAPAPDPLPGPAAPAPAPRSRLQGGPAWLLEGGFLRVSGTSGERDLDRWLPTRAELPGYLEEVRELLAAAGLLVQRKEVMPARHAPTFRHLVLATAWQESCWRQFVRRAGAAVPLTSSAGALGIMQVNPHVWRGLYEVPKLRASMRYNAVAGSEILHHYLVDYALARGEHEVRGRPDDLARAAYSAYNAGPRQLDRYRRAIGGGTGHRIDTDFYEKYQRVQAGDELAVLSCYPGGSA